MTHVVEESNIIELKKVCCKAGYRFLLRDVDWAVKPGEHWVVFGMNGSGKTTLLSIIAGFKHYTKGTVKVFDEEYTNENILGIRRKIGLVSASFFDRYYTKESVLNIVLSGKYGTLSLDEDITLQDVRLAKELLCELKLEDKIDCSFETLSKGERQNVLIARALFSNPDILILDEPCTGLDIYNRSYLFQTIEELSKRKELTIIYVTHYVEEITPLFDKILLLRQGTVYAKGKTKDLITEDVFCDFLGYPVEIRLDERGRYQADVKTKSNMIQLLYQNEISEKLQQEQGGE